MTAHPHHAERFIFPQSAMVSTFRILRVIDRVEDQSQSADACPRATESETVKVPQMAESISEGTLKQWIKKKGDFVEADEEVATIETDKVPLPLAQEWPGSILTIGERTD